jgi:hypothetical protein
MEQTIFFPSNSSTKSILDFSDQICSVPVDYLITVDFGPMLRIEPFAMVYLSKIIRDVIRKNANKKIMCRNHENKDYASHMGFFKAFNLDHGNAPGQAWGSSTYLPLTSLSIAEIQEEARDEWEPEQEIIERKSKALSQKLSQQNDGNLVETLTYSIREIMRNIFEHSSATEIWYCAQYWPAYGNAEIAIIDEGIGIKESIRHNPFLQVDCDADAIQQSIMPGISSKNYKGARVDRSNPWHNSGYGLYMTSRLCRNGGAIYIGTGNHGILLNQLGKTHFDLNHYCQGTVIKLVLSLSRLNELSQQLAVFRDEGYKIASQIKGVGYYSASAASQMLSRDFKDN